MRTRTCTSETCTSPPPLDALVYIYYILTSTYILTYILTTIY